MNRHWDFSLENQTEKHCSYLESTFNSSYIYFHLFQFVAHASHVLVWLSTLKNLILFVVCYHHFSPSPHITMNCFPWMSLKCCLESSQALQVVLNSLLISLEIVFHASDCILIIYFLVKVKRQKIMLLPSLIFRLKKKSETSFVILLI